MSAAPDRSPTKQLRSEEVYERVRTDVLQGAFGPGEPLKPQELGTSMGVSLAVVREALLRLVGDGLADRLPNRGFAVPLATNDRWQQLAEARRVLEPAMLRMAIERGDVEWEAQVRAAHHNLIRTKPEDGSGGPHYGSEWATAHHRFHRSLLEGCGNPVLLESFERLWTAFELARRWSGYRNTSRDHVGEHGELEEAALRRSADEAVDLLTRHLTITAEVLAADGTTGTAGAAG